MRIVRVTRRWGFADFAADYECGHCGTLQHYGSGYDDPNFHVNVIPKMKCEGCGKDGTNEPEPSSAVTLDSGKGWAVGKHGKFPLVLAEFSQHQGRLTTDDARSFAAAIIEVCDEIEG